MSPRSSSAMLRTPHSAIAIRSNLRRLPVDAATTITRLARMTAMIFGTPR